MERPSFSVEQAIECFIFECSCSNMIVAYTDKKKKKKRQGGKIHNAIPYGALHVKYTLLQYAHHRLTHTVVYSLFDTHSHLTTH